MSNISVNTSGDEEEEWRPVVGYEGYYEVSNMGRVKSLNRIIIDKRGSSKKISERIVSLSPCPLGYLGVGLYNGTSKGKRRLVHRLVAQAFIENTELKPFVNHKNGIKNDNKQSNLEWCTQKENMQHAHDNGLIVIHRGKDSKSSKLNDLQVIEICSLLDNGISQISIASQYNVHETTINAIHTGRKWNHLTERFQTIEHYGNNKGSNNYRAKRVINCRGEVFGTITEASKAYGLISTSNISIVCKGGRRYTGSYEDGTRIRWQYLDDI